MSEPTLLTERLMTRGYELDHDETIPLAAYMRYLEHMRWVSRGRLRGRRGEGRGVVRAQRIEIYHALGAHVELEMTAWISRMGRTSMDMSHDLIRIQDGELIGRSTATLVAIDEAGRPTPFPTETPPVILERPTVDAMRLHEQVPADAFSRPLEVRRSDHDRQQHVNQARYGEFIEDTRIGCADAGGYGAGDWLRPLRRFAISYEREAAAGDPLVARSWRAFDAAGALAFQLDRGLDDVVVRARVEL
jgi:acyl-CoA thioesterase FadM